jgi:hypothetical protein
MMGQIREGGYLLRISFLFLDAPEMCVRRVRERIDGTCSLILRISFSSSLSAKGRNVWYWRMPYSTNFSSLSRRPMSTRSDEEAGILKETYREVVELTRIGNRAVRRAQEENRKRGIPNVYSIQGHIYYERPDGTLTRDDPFPDGEEDS